MGGRDLLLLEEETVYGSRLPFDRNLCDAVSKSCMRSRWKGEKIAMEGDGFGRLGHHRHSACAATHEGASCCASMGGKDGRNVGQSDARGFVVVGTSSGCGKTTVCAGMAAAWKRRSWNVQTYKAGPDFLDGMHLAEASGRPCVNLDAWMMGKKQCQRLAREKGKDADVLLVEGMMGLFDGREGGSEEGSTAQLAKWLNMPVVLVVDSGASVRSAAAMISGFVHFDPELEFAGVIFNRVGGETHLQWLKDAMQSAGMNVPVLGGVPFTSEIQLPERYLGLHQPKETDRHAELLDALGEVIEKHVHLDQIVHVEKNPEHLPKEGSFSWDTVESVEQELSAEEECDSNKQVRIGVPKDEAFCFYYQDNLDLLEKAGAELVFFSPLRDMLPPHIQGLYIGGGYPELYANQLAANRGLLQAIRHFCMNGGVVYGECGGLMYLSQKIRNSNGPWYAMCNVLPLSIEVGKNIKMGYTQVEVLAGCPIFPEGLTVRGQVFHRSEVLEYPAEDRSLSRQESGASCSLVFSARIESPGHPLTTEGYCMRNTLATYVHLSFSSNEEFPTYLVEACRNVPVELARSAIDAGSVVPPAPPALRTHGKRRMNGGSEARPLVHFSEIEPWEVKKEGNDREVERMVEEVANNSDESSSGGNRNGAVGVIYHSSSKAGTLHTISCTGESEPVGMRSRASMPNLANAHSVDSSLIRDARHSKSESKIFDDSFLQLDYEMGDRFADDTDLHLISLEGKSLERYRPLDRKEAIASLFSSATEILFALGLGYRVIGVSDSCEFPPQASVHKFIVSKRVARLASGVGLAENASWLLTPGPVRQSQVDVKWMQAFKPGLVIAEGGSGTLLETHCSGCGKVVRIGRPRSLGDVFDRIQEIAQSANAQSNGLALVNALRKRLRLVAQEVVPDLAKRPKVLTLVGISPLYIGGHWLPEMEFLAGGRSELQNPGDFVERIVWEDIRALRPDVLILASHRRSPEQVLSEVAQLALQPGWWKLPAVQTGRVYIVEPTLFIKAGPRLVQGVEILSKILHPDISSKTIPADACLKLVLEGGKRCRPQHLRKYFKSYP